MSKQQGHRSSASQQPTEQPRTTTATNDRDEPSTSTAVEKGPGTNAIDRERPVVNSDEQRRKTNTQAADDAEDYPECDVDRSARPER